MSSTNQQDASATPEVRIKLPWPVVFAGAASAAVFAAVLWASVQNLTEQVRELKIAVQAFSTITVTLQQDVNLLKFRQDSTDKRIENLSK